MKMSHVAVLIASALPSIASASPSPTAILLEAEPVPTVPATSIGSFQKFRFSQYYQVAFYSIGNGQRENLHVDVAVIGQATPVRLHARVFTGFEEPNNLWKLGMRGSDFVGSQCFDEQGMIHDVEGYDCFQIYQESGTGEFFKHRLYVSGKKTYFKGLGPASDVKLYFDRDTKGSRN